MKHNLWKVFLSFILAILASVALALPAFAVSADSTPWTFEQPCGQILTLTTFGDEFFMWSETESGHVVEFDWDTDTWYYAYIEGGKLKPGDIAAGQASVFRGEFTQRMSRDDIQSVIEGVDRSASVKLVEDIAGPRSAPARSSIEQEVL